MSNRLIPYKAFVFLVAHSVLLVLAWHSQATVFLLFFAFIPIFYFFDNSPKSYNEKIKLYIFSYLAVFFWIYFTIHWIKPIDSKSHFFTTLITATLLYVPYLVAYYFRFSIKKSSAVSKIIFISVWVVIELCHDIDLIGFPYLNLGHTLAAYPALIQWYAWTGSIGGTIWVLLVNLSLYQLILLVNSKEKMVWKNVVWSWLVYLSIILAPVIVSFLLTTTSPKNVETSFNVVCVHTSADVYDYKYEVEPEVLLEDYLELTLKYIDSNKENLIVWPENALTGDIFFNELDSSPIIRKIKQELCYTTNNLLISGAIVDEIVNTPDSGLYVPNILHDASDGYFFKRYNAALLISSFAPTLIKTKKRLVPYGEKIPHQKIFSPLVSLLPNLASLNFSSKQDKYPIFSNQDSDIRTSPIICYGSAFSDYVADEILKTKSNLIVVIMNEGWMKNEKAYNHFNWFSVCRAIENRRQLVKSSNEGISALINSNGEIEKSVTGIKADVLQGKLYTNDNYSFFTRHHSKIHYGLLTVGLIFILIQLLISKIKK